MSNTKPRRFVAVGDNHGDMIDSETESALFAFIEDFKPEVRVHLGDCFDFRALRKGASEDERRQSVSNDLVAGKKFIRDFFKGGKENHFLRGNHDERLWRLLESSNGSVVDHAKLLVADIERSLKRAGAKVLPYDSRLGVLRIGHLKFIHGYAAGIGATAKHARSYGCVIHGHTHTIEVAAVDSDDGPREARAIGALCQLDMPYNAHHLGKLRHSNGFAYGYLFENGDYQIFQARKIEGKIYAASDIKTY
jgi:predicted phosphodiesterase